MGRWLPIACIGLWAAIGAMGKDNVYTIPHTKWKEDDSDNIEEIPSNYIKDLSKDQDHAVTKLIKRFVDASDGHENITDLEGDEVTVKSSCPDFSCVTGTKLSTKSSDGGDIEWERYELGDMTPYVVYRLKVGAERGDGEDDTIYCTTPVTQIGNAEFQCVDGDGDNKLVDSTAKFRQFVGVQDFGDVELCLQDCSEQIGDVKVTYERPEGAHEAFDVLAAWRAHEAYEAWTTVADAQLFIQDRLAQGRNVTKGFFCVVLMGGTMLGFLGALWISWLFKCCKGPQDLKICIVDRGLLSFWCTFTIFLVIFYVLLFPSAYSTFLSGLVAVAIFVGLAAIIQIIYCCKDPNSWCKCFGSTQYAKKKVTGDVEQLGKKDGSVAPEYEPCDDPKDADVIEWRPCKLCCAPIYDPAQPGQFARIDEHPFMGDDEDHCYLTCCNAEKRDSMKLWDNSDKRYESYTQYKNELNGEKEAEKVNKDKKMKRTKTQGEDVLHLKSKCEVEEKKTCCWRYKIDRGLWKDWNRIWFYICRGPFRTLPYRETREQHNCKWCCMIMFFVCFAVLMLIVLLYNPPFYQIVDRNTQRVEDELQSKWAPRMFMFGYSLPTVARDLHLDEIFRDYVQKDSCGIGKMNKTAEEFGDGGTEKVKSMIFDDKIDTLKVDMEDYMRVEWDEFYSVNDWFTRMIKLGDILSPDPAGNSPTMRPVAMCYPYLGRCAQEVISAPADARYLVFPTVEDSQRFWLKDKEFSVNELLQQNRHAMEDFDPPFPDTEKAEKGDGSTPEAGQPTSDWIKDTFTGGSVVIARLAPQDYHRYHTHATGQIFYDYLIEGTEFYSVNYEAMPSKNGAIFNKRRITILKNPELGWMAYVNLGAACTSSIVQSTVAKEPCGDTADECTYEIEDYISCPRPQAGPWDEKLPTGETCGKEGLEPEDTVGNYWKFRGDEFGYFQFGGSTIVMIFQKDKIDWDPDLTFPSSRNDRPVESLVFMGQKLGHKKGWDLADWDA